MRNILIMGSNVTSIKMFADFYNSVYLKNAEPTIITLNSLYSDDIIEQVIQAAFDEQCDSRIFTMKVKEIYDNSRVNRLLMENCDIIVRFNKTEIEPELIKLPEEYQPVIERWKANIERMSI